MRLVLKVKVLLNVSVSSVREARQVVPSYLIDISTHRTSYDEAIQVLLTFSVYKPATLFLHSHFVPPAVPLLQLTSLVSWASHSLPPTMGVEMQQRRCWVSDNFASFRFPSCLHCSLARSVGGKNTLADGHNVEDII
jgi:hypothetical protein